MSPEVIVSRYPIVFEEAREPTKTSSLKKNNNFLKSTETVSVKQCPIGSTSRTLGYIPDIKPLSLIPKGFRQISKIKNILSKRNILSNIGHLVNALNFVTFHVIFISGVAVMGQLCEHFKKIKMLLLGE